MALAQELATGVASLLEFQCRNDLLVAQTPIDFKLPSTTTRITSAEWDEPGCDRLIYGCGA